MLDLYRADRIGNTTLPEKYYSDGLITKQLNSGDDPLPHKKYGWLKTILNHIQYNSDDEKFIFDTTQYLSFTSDLNRALFFLSTKEKYPVYKSERNSADAFIFKATIEYSKLKKFGEGVFIFAYKCNYDKTRNDPKFQSTISGFLGCNICSLHSNYEHRLLVINASNYLFEFRNQYPVEYELATKDKEWLLMPLDPMVGLNSICYQSRIQIADFWTVDFYKYSKR